MHFRLLDFSFAENHLNMEKLLHLLTGLLLWTAGLSAQVDVLSLESNYSRSLYYSIADGSTTAYNYTDWDIAFGVAGQSLAVLYNEGAVEGIAEIELYITESTDFESVDTTGMVRIYNNEVSWDAGAFNHVGSDEDPFDFGWGRYDVVTHQVNGTRVYVIKLRSGDYKKLKIESLDGGIYTFRYADLDGENEVMDAIDKSEYTGKTLAYYSLESGEARDLEPEQWDILFTRYTTPLALNDGTGAVLEYMVTGALTNTGIEVAQVDGIDPATVDFNEYDGLFSDTLTIIGHDWKSFDLDIFQFSVPNDRIYFIKNASGEVWKVQFIDFEGASTGGFALEKSLAGMVTSTSNRAKNFESFTLFPNPAGELINVNFELKTAADNALIRITNNLGQELWRESIRISEGLNTKTIPLQLSAGSYHLTVQSGKDFIGKPFLVKP